MLFDETKLKAQLKKNRLVRVYFLYGEEKFLTRLYADKLLAAAKVDTEDSFGFQKMQGSVELSALAEAVETIPVFTERRAVLVTDLDPEKYDAESASLLAELIASVPDSTLLIIAAVTAELDGKKAKTKKVLAAAEKSPDAVLCEFKPMTAAKAADLAVKKAARLGVVLSYDTAVYLCGRTLCDLVLIGTELDKLCAYCGYQGEITPPVVDLLVPRRLETRVFDLADCVAARDGARSFRMLRDLFEDGCDPIPLTAALAGSFADFYRIKLISERRVPPSQAGADFGYPANQVWKIGKFMPKVSRLSMGYIKKCLKMLFELDYKLKSSPLDKEMLTERTIAQLITA